MSSESPSFVFSTYMNMLDTDDGQPPGNPFDLALSPFSRAPPTAVRTNGDVQYPPIHAPAPIIVDPPSPLQSIHDTGLLVNGAPPSNTSLNGSGSTTRSQRMNSVHSSPSLLSPGDGDEHDEHDNDHDGDDNSARGTSADAQGNGNGKGRTGKGKGKSGSTPLLSNVTSNQMRRDQNRIAQREFRMRKQQHIKDLEARVEILSSDSEERQEMMALLVRSLLAENAQLRKMVKTMAAFVGEGLATSLPRIGVTLEEMHEFLTRPETESVHAAYQALKEARAKEAAGELKLGAGTAGGALDLSLMFKGVGEGSAGAGKRKRGSSVLTPLGTGAGAGSDDRDIGDSRARARSSLGQIPRGLEEDMPSGSSSRNDSPLKTNGGGLGAPPYQTGMPPKPATSTFGTAPNGRSFDMPALNEYAGFGAGGSAGGMPDDRSGYASAGQLPASYYGGRYPPGMTETSSAPWSAGVAGPAADGLGPAPDEPGQDLTSEWPAPANETMPGRGPTLAEANGGESHATPWDAVMAMEGKMLHAGGKHWEAIQLISYHMENYRQNSNYHLPPSLTPTAVQRGVAHEFIIDGIVQPCLRDQLILMRGKYDIMTVFQELVGEMSIPGEDPLDHRNWEISEEWMLRNFPLVTRELVGLANRWRAQRGERLLDYEDMRRRAVPGPAWK